MNNDNNTNSLSLKETTLSEETNSNKNKTLNKLEEEDIKNTNNKTIFVSGIPYTSTQDEIITLFKTFGEITEVKVPKYQDSNKNRGYAHITFKKNKSVKNAVNESNKIYIDNRYLTIEASKGEQIKERKIDISNDVPINCKTIIIKNLPYNTKEEDLGHKFKPCGSIKSIRLVYNSAYNHFKGFGFIDFESTEAVKNALYLNGKDFNGRNMIVDYEENKPRKGYKFRNDTHSKFNKDYKKMKSKVLNKKRKKE